MHTQTHTHTANNLDTHTHTRLTALFLGLPWSVGTRKVKPIWILLKQERVSGSGISWAICKSASRSRQITTPTPHHSFFTGQMPFLPPNQQRQSTEGNSISTIQLQQFLSWLPCFLHKYNKKRTPKDMQRQNW